MKLYLSDMYRIESSYPLDDIQNDILYYLYQPLIGAMALHVYMMFHVEAKRMLKDQQAASFSRCVSLSSLSLIDMEKAIRCLEAIGLLKTYVKYDHDMTYYLYQLQSPLSLKAFFKNQILTSLLEESLSQEDFERTVQYFKITVEDLHQYEEITAHFQDVFVVQRLKKKGKLLHYQEEFKEAKKQEIVVDYDQDLLMRSLRDYQISHTKLTKEDISYAIQLAIVYSIDPLTLAGLIKDSMESQGLNQKLLKTNIKKYYDLDHFTKLSEVYHKQPLQYTTHNQDNTPLVLHMQYLDTLSPYDLLKEKQGGKEPVLNDLKIVETLMVQLGLKPAVVNVLLEYVLAKNNHRLSKNYCEAIGSSLARKNVETAMEAYHELMNDGHNETVEQTLEYVSQDMEEDEIEQLLSELKEGLS